MNNLELSQEEEIQIKTICEYLFFDEFMDYVTYNRFEQCFQPLFNNIQISLYKVFKKICGEKRKYINFKRLINAYKLYKGNDPKLDPDLKIFFEKLLNSILKEENSFVGKSQEKAFNFSTPKACKRRDRISMIKILSDKEKAIHGLIIEYDNIVINKFFPSKLENYLLISLEMKLGNIDENAQSKGLGEELYKDAVTHIFGTISKETGFVNFLGFKCVSGKTVFVGYPEGDGFLFGKFGKKFHEIKIQLDIDGIILLQPGFNENKRANYFLINAEANKLTNEDALIQDEVQLSQLNDEIEIDKMITTPIIQEKDFMNKKLVDEISGNDYKEVVNQNAREWILKDPNVKEKKEVEGLLTVGDALEEIKQLEGGGGGKGFGRKKRKKKPKNNKKWNGQIENIKNIKPLSFLKNKDNYKKLKDQIKQGINEEFSIKDEYFSSNIGQSLIKQALLEEKPQKKKKKVSTSPYLIPNFKTNIKSVKSKKMNGEEKIVKFAKKSKSVQKPKTSTVEITIEDEEGNTKNLFCSDAQNMKNILEKMNNEGNIAEFLVDGTKARGKKTTDPIEKWKQFGNKIRKTSISLLLQTIGQIIRGIHKLAEEIDTGKKMPIKEKLQLYKLLDDNEKILEFLSTKEDKEEEEEEEILTPSEHPERITSLNEMETKLSRINNLLADKNLKPEEKKKLEQLKNLYLQQKNKLIENKTDKARNEIIEKANYNVKEYMKKEEERRNKAIEETRKKIEEEIKKEKSIIKEEKSIKEKEVKDKIFKNQEMYKGTEPWNDPIFKPGRETLCPYDEKLKKWILPADAIDDDVDGWEDFEWCRVEEIFDSKNYSLFYEGISIGDIIQGGISDCYFLSVLGSLCEYTKLVDKLFYFKEKTKEHIYGIYFYINGTKKLVLIDDYIPYIKADSKQIAVSKSACNEIWVSLIEKAWAKVNGNYIRIGNGGSPNEVFDVLTEAYSEEITVRHLTAGSLWEKLEDGKKKGFVMTAGTYGTYSVRDAGLIAGHAYTVLGLHEIKGEKVIRLRNPWGEENYNGAWSDNSSKWTKELKEKYKFDEKEDGDFYMGYKDFLKYFMNIGFAKLHPDFTSSRIKIKKSEAIKCQLIKVTITQNKTLVYFQLYGKNPRIPNKKGVYPKTTLCNLILVDKDFNYIDGIAGNNMHICVEATLKKGEYYLFSDANFRYNKDMEKHGYTITAYSGIDIPMENVTEKNDVPSLLRKVLIDYCKKKEKPNKQKNGINVYISKPFNQEIPYKVFTFENKSKNNYAVLAELECKGAKSCCFYCDEIASEDNIKVIKNIKAKETITIIIMPYNLSSKFDCEPQFTDYNERNDPTYNHRVFDNEGEAIDNEGKIIQYVLKKSDDSFYIGIENTSTKKLKLKLILGDSVVNDGPYKGQTSCVFELDIKGRKVFDVIVDGVDPEFEFTYA